MLKSVRSVAAVALLIAAPLDATPTPSGPGAQAYVQGRLAMSDARLDVAASRFDEAMKLGTADEQLQRRALEVAMLAGDQRAAFRLATALNSAALASGAGTGSGSVSQSNALIAMTAMVAAATAQNWRAYGQARAGLVEPARTATSTPVVGAILDAYGHAARQAWDAALQALALPAETAVARSYIDEHRAHILGMARRWPEAADAYGALVAGEGASVPRLRLAAAAAGLQAGQTNQSYRDKAIAVLGGGASEDPVLQQARAKLAADPTQDGSNLGGLVDSSGDGIALLFMRLASDLGRDRVATAAMSFARLATFLAPGMQESWLVAADTLARQDRPLLALAALEKARNIEPYSGQIIARKAAILVEEKRWDEARALIMPLTARRNARREDWVRLADLERRQGEFSASAASMKQAIVLVPPEKTAELAQYRFMRGAALEQAGEWPGAEIELRQAVALQPDNPIYLNYLGYSLLDRRLTLSEANVWIAKAFALAPDNGAIIDSMGWAAFVARDYAEAVRLLDMARAAEPADAAVADHLGDALWMAGRRIEARHAWAAAAGLEPDAKLAEKLDRKLDFGLDVALARR